MRATKLLLIVLSCMLVIGCKTQKELVSCEEVANINDVSWLSSIKQKGATQQGQQLISIDKITYSKEGSDIIYTGFDVRYETKCCDIPSEFIYDCDGENITFYGGVAGCSGECDINIRSRTNLYTAK